MLKGVALQAWELKLINDHTHRCRPPRPAYGCGLRRSEVVGIDLAHIDSKERAIRILGKGNSAFEQALLNIFESNGKQLFADIGAQMLAHRFR